MVEIVNPQDAARVRDMEGLWAELAKVRAELDEAKDAHLRHIDRATTRTAQRNEAWLHLPAETRERLWAKWQTRDEASPATTAEPTTQVADCGCPIESQQAVITRHSRECSKEQRLAAFAASVEDEDELVPHVEHVSRAEYDAIVAMADAPPMPEVFAPWDDDEPADEPKADPYPLVHRASTEAYLRQVIAMDGATGFTVDDQRWWRHTQGSWHKATDA